MIQAKGMMTEKYDGLVQTCFHNGKNVFDFFTNFYPKFDRIFPWQNSSQPKNMMIWFFHLANQNCSTESFFQNSKSTQI